MPLPSLVRAMDPPAPAHVLEAADGLSFRDFLTVALVVPESAGFPDNWIYIHEPGVRVGRVQNFGSWSPQLVKDGYTCLGLEFFVSRGDDLWESTDEELIALGKAELATLGLAQTDQVQAGYVVRVPKAYPVYDEGYAERVDLLRGWLAETVPNVHPVGRNGMHRYNNQDHSMLTAMLTVDNIVTGAQHDVWTVNVEEDYHETVSPSSNDDAVYPADRPAPRTGRDAPILLPELLTRDIVLSMGADRTMGLATSFNARIARTSLVDNGVAETSGLRIEGISGESGQTRFALGQFAVTGFSAAPAFAALRSDLASGRFGKGQPAGSTEQMLRYVPKLGSVRMADLRIETPNDTSKQAVKEFSPLTALGLRLIEITVRAQENGIPSDLRLAMEGLQAPVSKSDPDHALLARMGYGAIDTSARIDLAWNRDRNEIAVTEIGLDSVDMSKLKISGTIGNATKDLFSGDTALAQVAAFGTTLKTLDLKLENLGLMDRYMAMEARKAGSGAQWPHCSCPPFSVIPMPQRPSPALSPGSSPVRNR